MPIIKSAIKRVKQSEAHRQRNVVFKRQLRNSVKEFEAAAEAKESKNLSKLLMKIYSSYDTAVKKNLIHKNKAARKKSYYSAVAKKLNAKPAKTASKTPLAKKTANKKVAAKK